MYVLNSSSQPFTVGSQLFRETKDLYKKIWISTKFYSSFKSEGEWFWEQIKVNNKNRNQIKSFKIYILQFGFVVKYFLGKSVMSFGDDLLVNQLNPVHPNNVPMCAKLCNLQMETILWKKSSQIFFAVFWVIWKNKKDD